MQNAEIQGYLNERYPLFLEYAFYHAFKAKLTHAGGDVLNEALLNLLQKDGAFIKSIYSQIAGKRRELDFYILKEIKRICYSRPNPYRCAFSHSAINNRMRNT